MKSTSGYSVKYLRANDYIAQVVERWNSFAHKRQDLLGFIDVVGIHIDKFGVAGIQSCDRFDINRHFDKMKESCEVSVLVWLKAGNSLYFHGWDKLHRGLTRLRIVRVVSDNDKLELIDETDIEIKTSELNKGKIVIGEVKK
jgi:hypothetical protein